MEAPMRLGIGSYTYTWGIGFPGQYPTHPLGPMDLLERARRLGVHVVQICDNLPLDGLSPDELGTLSSRATDWGIEIELGIRGIGPDRLRASLWLAQRLKSRILRVVVDTADHHPSADEVVQSIKASAHDLERAGVYLAVENHDRFTTETLVGMMEEIGSPMVGICLDTANSLGALEGPRVVVEALAPWTINLHVKDFVVRRTNYTMGFVVEGRPAGQGQLDIPWILQTLRATGRDLSAIVELWTPPEETLAATVAKEEAWAATSVAYLRGLIDR